MNATTVIINKIIDANNNKVLDACTDLLATFLYEGIIVDERELEMEIKEVVNISKTSKTADDIMGWVYDSMRSGFGISAAGSLMPVTYEK